MNAQTATLTVLDVGEALLRVILESPGRLVLLGPWVQRVTVATKELQDWMAEQEATGKKAVWDRLGIRESRVLEVLWGLMDQQARMGILGYLEEREIRAKLVRLEFQALPGCRVDRARKGTAELRVVRGLKDLPAPPVPWAPQAQAELKGRWGFPVLRDSKESKERREAKALREYQGQRDPW